MALIGHGGATGPINDSASARDRRRLDYDVLLITAVLWFANLSILVTRAAALNIESSWEKTGIRLAVSILSAGVSLAIYAILRDKPFHAVRRFLLLAAAFVPISLGIAAINEASWLVLTDYYQVHYGISPSQLFAGRCVGKSGCSPFFLETTFTAVATLWIYVAWTALYISALTAAEVRNRDRRLVTAEAAAHQAQLAVLRFQLNPHFLFNTLNTLSGLIALDRKDQAEQILMNLSAFLRRALRKESQQMVSLRTEIAGEQMYLDIERARFGDRMKVEVSIEPQCESASVPAFILQPLVENSIKHAVAVAQKDVTIWISAHKHDGQLELTVENSDPGADPPEKNASGFGIGLENVQMRLSAVYGRDAKLAVKITSDKHWQNTLSIPWREHSSDDASTDR